MIVERVVPRPGPLEVEELLRGLRDAPRDCAGPFHPERIEFSAAVSRAIFDHPPARAYPELHAAAFWLRRAEVSRLAQQFRELEAMGSMRAPRGLAFHLPPTNVDTMFMYPLITSFLVGNLNVVRVSRTRFSPQVRVLCDVLEGVLAQERFAGFGQELAVISYDHEAEPTAELSREADVRLLWGGDQTVARLRAVPIRPTAHELTFGDRFGFAVLRPDAVLEADAQSRSTLAERLFRDMYWFDQLACASPRLLVWVGDKAKVSDARRILFEELAQVIATRGYRLTPGPAIARLTFTYQALIDRPVERVDRFGDSLVVLSLTDLSAFDRSHPGFGLLFEARVDSLSDLVGFVKRKDQTVVAHGFSNTELTAFARSLHGRGVDRIVGFGDALSFGRFWDGYDLIAELTRTIHVVEAADAPEAATVEQAIAASVR
jgi:Acyl-CoA reductase (LuxC)